jgi:hypothetical protein
MNEELIRKKFTIVLERWMKEHGLDDAGLAWLLDVCTKTVQNWRSGWSMPNGRNAILLAYFADPIAPVLQKWAGVDAATKRWDELPNGARKAA